MNLTTSVFFIFLTLSCSALATSLPSSDRSKKSISLVEPMLKLELQAKGLKYGSPVFMRLFKDPGYLEVWIESSNGQYQKFKEYDICTFSGNLGPKLRQGDKQSPEGFYVVGPGKLNPWSKFHLSFNMGYPNIYDRQHGRTGSALMVHGNCVSIGCYAMTNGQMNEIYALAFAAFDAGQRFFDVHSFPFKLDDDILDNYKSNKWHPFWQNLKGGYDHFNQYKTPPKVVADNGTYVFYR